MAEKIDQAIKEEALQMIREGVTGVEVARRFGVHKDTIRKWRKAAGLSGIGSEMTGNQSKNPEIIRDVLALIDEGKNDTEISKIIGLSKYHLRRIRDDNGRPRSQQWANQLTVELINTVIDMIRGGYTLTEISLQTGVSASKIKQLHREEIREGNPLPEIKKGKSVTQKYSDEELIELAFLNPGFGFERFTKYLGVKRNFVMDLFLEFREFSGGEEDPLGWLQDPSNHTLVSEAEYKQITGRKYVPKGMGRPTAKRAVGKNKGRHLKIQLPPQEFNWGSFSPKMWHFKQHPAHELKGEISVSEWIENKISEKGYVRFGEDSTDFSESTGGGASKSAFRKWMERSELQYDPRYGYWKK